MPAGSERKLLHGTLKDLPDLQYRDELDGPVMVIIGDAVAVRISSGLGSCRPEEYRHQNCGDAQQTDEVRN